MKYLSITQTAERWGISTRRIQILCGEGRVPGAIRIGTVWGIPEDAEKPADARIKNGKYINAKNDEGQQQAASSYVAERGQRTAYTDFRHPGMKTNILYLDGHAATSGNSPGLYRYNVPEGYYLWYGWNNL